jgi:uncharacterized protein
MEETLQKLEQIAKAEMSAISDSAHDMDHIHRVYRIAEAIAKEEAGVDREILLAATLLHDIGVVREQDDPSGQTDHALESAKMARPILEDLDFSPDRIKRIEACIISHRYKTENKPESIEAKILFDADKLDSVGAIGIARAFVWVGRNHAHIYKRADKQEDMNNQTEGGRIKDKTAHSPQKEYELKTRFVCERLYTETARRICNERSAYFKAFLDRLEEEIEGKL